MKSFDCKEFSDMDVKNVAIKSVDPLLIPSDYDKQ